MMYRQLNFKMMKTKILLVAFVLTVGMFFTSCDKEEEIAKPEITSIEYGSSHENSDDHIAILGDDMHIEAAIYAEGKVDYITVEIHPEGEEEEEEEEHEGWEFDSTYTEGFNGVKNPTFHKHIEISASADTGEYHFHFIVVDMEGNQVIYEGDIEIQQPDDEIAPEIIVSSAPSSGQVFANGETISISGSVSDETYLGGLYIGLVREDQGLSDADVNDNNTITILHTHDFDSYTAHNFSSNITVGATQDNNIEPKDISGDIAWQSGNYYVVVKCKDAFGGNWTFSSHFPVVINY